MEFGRSSTVLKIQIENNLFQRQIEKNKVNNFTATFPKPQSDLANYLLKNPFIFDLSGVRERANERDIEEPSVNHVTKYLLEMGNGFAFVVRQKHFQLSKAVPEKLKSALPTIEEGEEELFHLLEEDKSKEK